MPKKPAPNPAKPTPPGIPSSPSPGTPGEGRGEGSPKPPSVPISDAPLSGPHPNPLPEYRARGKSWTPDQLRGITTVGHSLLVSAAAGSGKTAMLAERCAYLVCDAPDPCDVDELLVVTFTEAAAAEMKTRIHAALRERAGEKDSARLRRQLALIDRAQVSTLHSFCARLLREHFHSIELDPAFSVIDGEEAALLRRETARMLFDNRYEFDEDGAFQRFIDAYGEGDDGALIRRVIQTHEMLRSLVDPQAWIDRSRARIEEAIDGSFEQSELGRELVELISRGLEDTRRLCLRSIELIERLKTFPKYLENLRDRLKALNFWQEQLTECGIDALRELVTTTEFPRLAAVPSATPNKELAKSAVDAVVAAMKEGNWRDPLEFAVEEWRQGLAATQPHANVFLDLVEDFGRRYGEAKRASRVVDFSDLEQLALAVLSDGPPARGKPSPQAIAYHQQFKQVLVDEYQDINQVQDAILALLSRECLCDEQPALGNLFCVGDVKQSIYRFRLAEAGRFLDRQKLYRATQSPRRGEVIDLQANFRSREPLLNAINSVFSKLMTESAVEIQYDQSHELRAGLKYPANDGRTCFAGAPIEMHLLPQELATDDEATEEESELDRSELEAVLTAQRIRTLIGLDGSPPTFIVEKDKSGQMQPRRIRFGDVVILLRTIRHKAGQFADILRRSGIPVHCQSSTGYFESTEIRDMLALLSVLDNQRQDIPLAAVLRSPIANLPQVEDIFAGVRAAYPAEVPFHDAVVAYANDKTDAVGQHLGAFLKILDDWRTLAHSRPLADVIATIFEQTGYLTFCAGLHDGPQRVANLLDFQQRAANFGSFQRRGISRFMQFLESLRDETDLGQPSIGSEADNVVRMMSIHRAKGLEFPVVLLPDLGKRINLTDATGSILTDRQAGLGMAVVDERRMIRYPSLTSVLVQQRLRRQALAEELRVLYVAMTRAREHLILIGTCKAEAAERWSRNWLDYAGPFPDDMILGAGTLLDWLGPTAVAAGEGVMKITQHTADEVSSWQASHAKRAVLSPRQAKLAALIPIEPAPPVDPVAAEIIERMTFSYGFDGFARQAASATVTGGRKMFTPARTVDENPNAPKLPKPRFVEERPTLPEDVGSATHLVLQHLDFAQSLDAGNIASQIESMVKRNQITLAQAKAVSQDSILWLAGSEVGVLLKKNAVRLWRESPIHFAQAPNGLPASADPQDRVMVRGRIDVMLLDEQGPAIIDYKSDNVPAAFVAKRAKEYAPQLEQYEAAVKTITRSDSCRTFLVFLTPQVICRSGDSGSSGAK